MEMELSTPQSKEHSKSTGKLLSPEEWVVCKRFTTGEAPHNQRAQALLAIDTGVTQAEAAIQSGLTGEQVRYWLGKFRKDRLSIFPLALLDQPLAELAPAASVGPAEGMDPTADQEESERQPKQKARKKKAGKEKKDNQRKQSKKAGKTKKAKKARPAKKSKKKALKGKKLKQA